MSYLKRGIHYWIKIVKNRNTQVPQCSTKNANYWKIKVQQKTFNFESTVDSTDTTAYY